MQAPTQQPTLVHTFIGNPSRWQLRTRCSARCGCQRQAMCILRIGCRVAGDRISFLLAWHVERARGAPTPTASDLVPWVWRSALRSPAAAQPMPGRSVSKRDAIVSVPRSAPRASGTHGEGPPPLATPRPAPCGAGLGLFLPSENKRNLIFLHRSVCCCSPCAA